MDEKQNKKTFGITNLSLAFRIIYQNKAAVTPEIKGLKAHPSYITYANPLEVALSSNIFQRKHLRLGVSLGFNRGKNPIEQFGNSNYNYGRHIFFEAYSVFIEPYVEYDLQRGKKHSFYGGLGIRAAYNFVGGGGNTFLELQNSPSGGQYSKATNDYPLHNTITPSLDAKIGYRIIGLSYTFTFSLTRTQNLVTPGKLPVHYQTASTDKSATMKLNTSSWGIEVAYRYFW